jgi:hypothetical protein
MKIHDRPISSAGCCIHESIETCKISSMPCHVGELVIKSLTAQFLKVFHQTPLKTVRGDDRASGVEQRVENNVRWHS